jgi:hypothetical protein
MGLVQLKGGVPKHVNGTTVNPAAVEQWPWTGGRSNYLWFQNTGTGAIVLSFSEADATAGIGVSVAAGADVLLPVEATSFWTKSTAAETFQAVAFLHRG